MQSIPYLNSVSLQEFFPLLAKLSQQLRMPIVALSIKTVGAGSCTDIGLVEFSAVTIGLSGNASHFLQKLNHGFSSEAKKALAGSPPEFPSIYDSVSKTFATSLVFGFGSAPYDVPVIYGQMIRYGLPIISARNQIDIREIWQKHVKAKGTLADAANYYKVESSPNDALVAARVLEAMLWRHGYDSVMSSLQCSLSSYLTPDQVLEVAVPVVANASPDRTDTATRHPSNKTSPGSIKPPQNKSGSKNDSTAAALKAEISKVVERHGVVRPGHLPEIAAAMGWNEAKTSIQIGTLITQGKIHGKPFLIPDQQAVLELHLPNVLKDLKEVKLKPIKESILKTTGHDVEFIQIRLALKALNVRLA